MIARYEFWNPRRALAVLATALSLGAASPPDAAVAPAATPAASAAKSAAAPAPASDKILPSPDRDAVRSTTVFLVRHAEKDLDFLGEDPPLTSAGNRRAHDLGNALRDAGISAIYVTRFRRSHDTAVPLATALGESLIVVTETEELVRRLRTRHAGDTVLVVGHSDSVPQVIEGLGGPKAADLGAVGYDGMWLVTFETQGTARVLRLHYGARVAPAH